MKGKICISLLCAASLVFIDTQLIFAKEEEEKETKLDKIIETVVQTAVKAEDKKEEKKEEKKAEKEEAKEIKKEEKQGDDEDKVKKVIIVQPAVIEAQTSVVTAPLIQQPTQAPQPTVQPKPEPVVQSEAIPATSTPVVTISQPQVEAPKAQLQDHIIIKKEVTPAPTVPTVTKIESIPAPLAVTTVPKPNPVEPVIETVIQFQPTTKKKVASTTPLISSTKKVDPPVTLSVPTKEVLVASVIDFAPLAKAIDYISPDYYGVPDTLTKYQSMILVSIASLLAIAGITLMTKSYVSQKAEKRFALAMRTES